MKHRALLMTQQQSISTADNTTVTEMRINSHHTIIHNSIHTYAINALVLSSAETFFNAYIAVLIPTIFNHIDKHFLLTWLYDSNWTDWQCTHFYCCFLLFTSQYKKYYMAIWMYKQLQIPSVKTFNSFAILERKGRIPVLISLIRHCLANSWNHQKQRQTEEVNRFWSQ